MFNADRSGVFQEGVVKVHLRRWLEDEDAWTLARYICSPHMQREASGLYKSHADYRDELPQIDAFRWIGFLVAFHEEGFLWRGAHQSSIAIHVGQES